MDNKKRIIIGILISIGVIVFITIMVIITNKKNIVGVYGNKNTIHKLVINEDKSCKYFFIDNNCEWKLSKDKVTFVLSGYSLHSDLYHYERNQQTSISENYKSKDECLNKIKELKETYDVLTPNCEYFETTYKAEIKDNGLLINDIFYEKIEDDN